MSRCASGLYGPLRALEGALIQQLVQEMPPNTHPFVGTPLILDRWLLGSALQKCIRRGLNVDATDVAIVLHGLDSEVAWRRLRIIAIEDVGLGNIETVATIMALAGKRKVRQLLGDQRLYVSLVQALCVAPKDRTACDLLCWIEMSPSVAAVRADMLDFPAHWESMALNEGLPIWQRVVAVQLIAGLTFRTRSGYRTVTRADTPGLWRVVEALDLQPMVAFASLKGTATESLNVALPFAQILHRQASIRPLRMCSPEAQVPSRIGGLIAPAFCMHTRVGLRALRLFLSQKADLRKQLLRAGATNLVRALGFLVFQIESGLLDRFEDYAPHVRVEAERAELAHYGITDDTDAATLRMELLRQFSAIDEAREMAWTEYQLEAPSSEAP